MLVTGSILFAVYGLVALYAYVAGFPLPVIVAGSLVVVVGQYWLGRKLALRSVGATDLPEGEFPRIHRTVEELSADMDIDKPRLMVAEMGVPNAFAVGRRGDGVVVVSTELLRLLDHEELSGVLAHELAHIRNRDVLVMVLGQSISMLVSYAVFFVLLFDEDVGAIAAWVASSVANALVMLVVLAISRYREYAADSDAREAVGSGEPLARALRKIEGAASGRRGSASGRRSADVDDSVAALCIFGGERGLLASLFATHPPVDKRVERLRE